MSRFKALYSRELLDDVTDNWIAADPIANRVLQELTFAVDQTLERDPHSVGDACSDDPLEREWATSAFNCKVRVGFTIFPDSNEVIVSFIALVPPVD
ncbi:hypothetical protein [Alienimonas chondri]|uniref:DUF4258 domain-containing protein n=1 Tax=Alienimonas chondri TaxID=2681879 RepID=A0ABX1VH82_9PLAN|nr:hypothetical protein [Alienimonas chondri]NNJ27169.1 hypothetical protein [Alienimonas chondri]